MSYVSTVLADAPANYWRLTEPAAQFVHDIGSNPQPLEGAGTNELVGFSGIASDGLSMLSPNGGGFLHNSTYWTPQATPCSIECWVWPRGHYTGATTPFIVDFGLFGLYDNGATNTFVAQAYVQNGGTSVAINSSPLSFWTWHHLVMTYTQTLLMLYVDGLPLTLGSAATAHNVATVLNIGQGSTGTRPFDGFITEVAFYSVALNSARIAAHHAAQEVFTQPFSLIGSSPGPSGGALPDTVQLASILAAVRHTFPTT